MRYTATLAILMLTAVGAASAQSVVQPGDEARKQTTEASTATAAGTDASTHENSFEKPSSDALEVHGRRRYREEERVGSYRQPRWSTRRRFPTTRLYVVPEGHFALEYWNRTTVGDLSKFGERAVSQIRNFYELEWGLGHRLQFDAYLVTQQEGTGPNEIHKETAEIRYALADWGELWGNPTLYLEWGREGGSGLVEGKLLLGGELAEGWHAGLNLVAEHKLADDAENEYKVTAGLSRTIADSRFSVGAETEVEFVDTKAKRFDFVEKHYLVGPSLSWQPNNNTHILLAPLVGLATADDESTTMLQNWLIVGWDY